MELAAVPAAPAIRGAAGADWRDYFALLKPRVMSLVVFTAAVGLVVAPSHPHPVISVVAILMIAIGAGAAGALNQWYEAGLDARMRRTARRPIPAGRVEPAAALEFALVLAVGSVLVMGVAVSWLAAALLAFSIVFYAVIYTVWLKPRTPHNIVIGGAAGAFPPVIGWAAATGEIGLLPVLLFAIVFLWTPPHFWALALFVRGDYAAAGVPMLPVVAGEAETRRQILLYSLVLAPVGAAPALLGLAGPVYAAVALALGAGFVLLAGRVARSTATQPAAMIAEKRLFRFSLIYLAAVFAALPLDRWLV